MYRHNTTGIVMDFAAIHLKSTIVINNTAIRCSSSISVYFAAVHFKERIFIVNINSSTIFCGVILNCCPAIHNQCARASRITSHNSSTFTIFTSIIILQGSTIAKDYCCTARYINKTGIRACLYSAVAAQCKVICLPYRTTVNGYIPECYNTSSSTCTK